ncbi:hypothetical protein YC2023_010303 [Brassica napus]
MAPLISSACFHKPDLRKCSTVTHKPMDHSSLAPLATIFPCFKSNMYLVYFLKFFWLGKIDFDKCFNKDRSLLQFLKAASCHFRYYTQVSPVHPSCWFKAVDEDARVKRVKNSFVCEIASVEK